MKQKKRGDIYSSMMKYLLMAFFSFIVLVAGFKGVAFIRDRACNAELAKFELDLSGIDKELRFGEKKLKDFRIPCKTSQIYLFDTSKKISPNDFDGIPLMKNALATSSSKNVFVIDRGKVKKSFYSGNIEAIYPYYLCLKPKFDRISFFAEGRENSAFLTVPCGQPDCTLIPINITEAEAQRIIQEAVYSQFGCDKCKYDYDLQNIKSTKEKVYLFRRFIVCNGITKVEIIIKPRKGAEVKNFRYYEYIPKECVDDLASYLKNLEPEENVIMQKNDPLIVWHFDEIEEETILSYELSKEFGESCKRIIEGLGVVQEIKGAVPPVPVCGDDLCNGLETCSTCPIDCGACEIFSIPDPCIGVLCDTPNPARCLNLNEFEAFDAPGTCIDGVCSYSSRIISCPGGCSDGICQGTDPCLGITCTTPPQARCRDSSNARTYVPVPCIDGACAYNYRDERCSDNKGVCRDNGCTCENNEDSCGIYPNCARCTSGGQCVSNQCQTLIPIPTSGYTCTPEARKDCVGDAIYWFNSCGERGRLYYDCKSKTGVFGSEAGSRDDCYRGKCCYINIGSFIGIGDRYTGCKDPGDRCPTSCTIDQQRCSGSGFEVCNDYDNDGCLEWGRFTNCPSGCDSSTNDCRREESEDEDERKASLSASYSIINTQQIDSVNTRYEYRLTLRETNNVQVTITSAQRCFQTGGCKDPVSLNIVVPPGDSLTRNEWFLNGFHPNSMTRTLSGIDANGKEVTVDYTIPVQ